MTTNSEAETATGQSSTYFEVLMTSKWKETNNPSNSVFQLKVEGHPGVKRHLLTEIIRNRGTAIYFNVLCMLTRRQKDGHFLSLGGGL